MPDDHALGLVPFDPIIWQPILQYSNQVVLYNPTSHALTIRAHSSSPLTPLCPYCNRPLELDKSSARSTSPSTHTHTHGANNETPFEAGIQSRVPNYFQLLAIANETSSRPPSPPISAGNTRRETRSRAFPAEAMAEGYFKTFFQEECRLGMGANGSVFLCQACPTHALSYPFKSSTTACIRREPTRLSCHFLCLRILLTTVLPGHFAVKKIAVGESHSYLLKILREVRLFYRSPCMTITNLFLRSAS